MVTGRVVIIAPWCDILSQIQMVANGRLVIVAPLCDILSQKQW